MLQRTPYALPSPPKSTGSAPDHPPVHRSTSKPTTQSNPPQHPSSSSFTLSVSAPSTISKQSHIRVDDEEPDDSTQTTRSASSVSSGPQMTRNNHESPDDIPPSQSILFNHPIMKFFALASKPRRICKSLHIPNTEKRADTHSTRYSFPNKYSRRSMDCLSKESVSCEPTFTVRPRSIFDIGRQPADELDDPILHALTEDHVRLHGIMTNSAVTNKIELMRRYLHEQRLLLATLCTMDPESDLPRSVARTNYLLNQQSHSSDSSSVFHKSPPVSPVASDDSHDTELEFPLMYATMGNDAFGRTSEFCRSIMRTLYGPKSRLSRRESDSRHSPQPLYLSVNNKLPSSDPSSPSQCIQPETLDSFAGLYSPINDYIHQTKKTDLETTTEYFKDEDLVEVLASPPTSIKSNHNTMHHTLSGATRSHTQGSPMPTTIDVQPTTFDFLEPSTKPTTPPCNPHCNKNATDPHILGKRNRPPRHLWNRLCTFLLRRPSQSEPFRKSSPIPQPSVSLGNLFRKTTHHSFPKDNPFSFSETAPEFSRRDFYHHQNTGIHKMSFRGLTSFPRFEQRKCRQEHC